MANSLPNIDDKTLLSLRNQYPGAFGATSKQLIRTLVVVSLVAYTVASLWYFEVWRLASASDRAWRLISAMFNWQDMANWQYAQIYSGIAQTLAMAFLGTILATIAALFIGFLAARNTMPISPIRHLVRRMLDVLRGVDQLVWGLVFVRAVGLGPLAGVLAIFVSDTGTLSKLYSEAIENIDRKQVEGIRATGAGPIKTVRYGYLPQVMPVFISQSLYFFESSTRSATILGLVGAGGVGMIIIERFRANLFDQVTFVVLNVLVCIFVIDWLSKKIREKFIGETRH
ncbi:phosphonate ABC transporter, permease protein PhnE [Aquamicrobium zhengzhouense]|uniref:Phosphonate ABC transporter, permease protein PhnE n=1 Tax=Aquamicrobium zhengzhouense TaxID=2781738 RepID=A0ABS0SDJ1_9HYPH|nr:phosphonate ABC transporter, permease protein PhnE [Aquamicrobium zhengzhouense]MBI1621374.1 phosphonate ABC transporter, permease protein PhnE [Aquamicrobium zhengzhouense]